MKNRKICLLLFIVQLILCFSFSVSAASENVALTLEGIPSSVEAGKEFTVFVNLEKNDGFKSATFEVKYDSEKLTYVGKVDFSEIGSVTVNGNKAGNVKVFVGDVWSAKEPGAPVYTATGYVIGLKFKADESTADYTTAVSVNASTKNVMDKDGKFTYAIAGDEKTITVKGSKHVAPTFAGSANLVLNDKIAMNFKVDPAAFAEGGYTNPYVVFNFNGNETTVTKYTVDTKGRYQFMFDDINPTQLGDDIEATLYATFAGEVVECATTVKAATGYCYAALALSDAELPAVYKTVIVDLLNYGAAAQVYAGYKTDALVNADLTEDQKAYGTETAAAVENKSNKAYATVENATATWGSAGLNLENGITLRYVVKAESIEGLSVKFTVSGNTYTVDASEFEATDGGYYVWFSELNPAQMREIVYATVYAGDVAVSDTWAFSAESYLSKLVAYPAFEDIAVATIKYCDAVKALVG